MLKRIGITLRREIWNEYRETRDAFDVDLSEIFVDVPSVMIPIPNYPDHVSAFWALMEFDALVLTGGANPGASPQRDKTETALLQEARKRKTPVLGICRGMQMINTFLGGTSVEAQGHVGVRHSVSGPLFGGLEREVNSFHRLAITTKSMAYGARPVASAQDGTVEAFTIDGLPWLGLMWHPEREKPVNELDLSIIKGWLCED